MTLVKALTNTLTTTKNFPTALSLKITSKKRTIHFRNGINITTTWAEYRKIRDCLTRNEFKKCNLTQKGQLYTIQTPELKLTVPQTLLFDLLEAYCAYNRLPPATYKISQKNDLFEIEGNGMKLIGSLQQISLLAEHEQGTYDCDCKGKTVLDIGGFQGETAVYFSKKGAKKIVIYEPVLEHHNLIKKNVLLNKVNAEIHQEGLGVKDSKLTINYANTNLSFGNLQEGLYKMEIQTKNATELIKQSKADIAKIDCEGAEEALLEVDNQTLRSIEYYIIEAHSRRIRLALIDKFTKANFEVKRIIGSMDVSIIHFKRV